MSTNARADTTELTLTDQLMIQLTQLAIETQKMRTAQAHFFRTRKPAAVREAKRCEQLVDERLDILRALNHPDLFLQPSDRVDA